MKIYDNTVDFDFSPTGHRYTVSKLIDTGQWTTPEPKLGITTITSIISKDALIAWSAKTAAYYMRDNWKTAKSIPALAEEARNAHRNEKIKAAGVGSVGHKMVESLLLGKEVVMPKREELKQAILNIRSQHESFEADFKPKTIHVEQPMYSLIHDFCGTDDRLCTINDKTVLIDYKTSNRSHYNPDGIYGSNFAQIGGQALLVEEMFKETVEDGWIVNFAKDSEEYKVKKLSDMGLSVADAKTYFLLCLGLYRLNRDFEWKVTK